MGMRSNRDRSEQVDAVDRLTDPARRALELARTEARSRGSGSIETEHILLGLIALDEGLAATVLSNLGIDPRKVRTAIEFLLGHGDEPYAGELRLSAPAKRAVRFAGQEAGRLGHQNIGTEHLLLGLVREGHGIAAGVLKSLDVGLSEAREEVVRVRSMVESSPELKQWTGVGASSSGQGLRICRGKEASQISRLKLLVVHSIQSLGAKTRSLR